MSLNAGSRAWLILWFGAAFAFYSFSHSHQLPQTLQGPSWHLGQWFGFDAFGRNLITISLRASAFSSLFALAAVLISCAIGILLGTAIALAPRPLRFLGLRGLEITLAFPSLLIALAWAAVRGPGWETLLVALAIGTLPSFTRLVTARARELLQEDYVHAARALGAGPVRLVWSHLTPALLSLCSVKLPGLFAHALLAEATLSFLGVGAPIGRDTWGSLLAQGKDYLLEAPHIAFAAGIPLVMTVLSLQLLSENWTERKKRISFRDGSH